MTDAGATTAWTFATAEGSAGIAVIFLAGPRAFEILSSVFRPAGKKHSGFEGGRLLYGHITEDETVLDEVIVAPFPEGNALFRGPFVEINCHGGVVCSREVGTLLDRLGACGVDRHAFSEAFSRLAGHEEHALERMIQAGTGRAVAVAQEALGGAGRERLDRIRAAACEETPAGRCRALELIRCTLAAARRADALLRPRRLAVVGPPNVGKSSLINALLGRERLLVDPLPGTTRDTVEVSLALSGWPVTVVDTAGVRETDDEVEDLGVRRSLREAGEADVVLLVLDARASDGALPARLKGMVRSPVVVALNKIDLVVDEADRRDAGEGAFPTCAITGQGLTELGAGLLVAAGLSDDGEETLLLEPRVVEEILDIERRITSRA